MDKTGCTVEPQKVDCQVEGRFLEVATAWGETEKLDEEVHEIEERSSEDHHRLRGHIEHPIWLVAV